MHPDQELHSRTLRRLWTVSCTRLQRPALRCFLLAALPAAVFVALAWRQHHLVDVYAVNVMYFDQFDFYLPIFRDEGAWAIFARQHGPPREGLGLLITNLLAQASDWNSRWDAFAVSFATIAASALAVWLAVKQGFRFGAATLFCGLLFLNLRQFESFLSAANLSAAAMPLVLLISACLCWFVRRPWLRAGALGLISFMLIFTGYGLFAGLVIPAVLFAERVYILRSGDRSRLRPLVATLAVIGIAWILFAYDYVLDEPVGNILEAAGTSPSEWLVFVSLMMANVVGIPGQGAVAVVAGTVVCVGVLVVCCWHAARLFRSHEAPAPSSQVVFTLTAFTLIFAAHAALGRVCLGRGGALASRYIPLMAPALLGLFLHTKHLPERLRTVAQTVLVIGVAMGMSILRQGDWSAIHSLHDGRLAWRQAYMESHDPGIATARSGFAVYPEPGEIRERLDFLEAHRLNLFSKPEVP